MNFEQLYTQRAMSEDWLSELRFQDKLAAFIIEHELHLIVETGSGLTAMKIHSTKFTL